jgi:alpha-tubulin suppressor-like RCC1 family protein
VVRALAAALPVAACAGLLGALAVPADVKAASPGPGVVGFGQDGYGQLGDGASASAPFPVAASGLPRVTAVAAGCYHSLALTADGAVWAWGLNDDGQLGDGGTARHALPEPVTGLPGGVVGIAAGCHHSVAVTSSGQVFAWGEAAQGQIGDGVNTLSGRLRPVHVAALDGLQVARVAAGGQHSAAVTAHGAVYAWGDNRSGQLGVGDTAGRSVPVLVGALPALAGVGLGQGHSLFVGIDHTLYAAGLNDHGQLGDGSTANRVAPVLVGHDVVQASAGDGFSVAAGVSGAVLSWGRADAGRLGSGGAAERHAPAAVPGTGDAVEVAVGGRHVLARTRNGGLITWGDGGAGQLGDGGQVVRATPALSTAVQNVRGVAAGESHSLVLVGVPSAPASGATPEATTGIGLPNTSASPGTTVLAAAGALLLATGISRRRRR